VQVLQLLGTAELGTRVTKADSFSFAAVVHQYHFL
jgi:hypothetical protein